MKPTEATTAPASLAAANPCSPVPRRRMLLAVGGAALLSSGCMTKPLRAANADGTYCHRTGKSYQPKLSCTPEPIPAPQVEEDAKRFGGTPDRFTIYIVRKRWGDAANLVRLRAPSARAVDMVPETFARLRLAPGLHALTLSWPEGQATLEVTGQAGEVRFVEVIGTVWAWGSDFRLEAGKADDSKQRARHLRLVADVA